MTAATERARIDAPEHAAWAEHACDDCRPGLSCPARRALREIADRADWKLITPQGLTV